MPIRRRAIVLLACTLGALASPVSAKTALNLVQQYVDGKNGVDYLGGASGVAFDPTGVIRLYVAGREGTLSFFNREIDGLLTFDRAARQGVDGADGLLQANVLATTIGDFVDVYVGSDRAVALVHDHLSDTSFGQISSLPSDPTAIAVSPGGENVYVTAAPATTTLSLLRVYGRDGVTGELTAIADITNEAGLRRTSAVTVSPDGKNVYATGRLANALVVFARSPTTGELFFLQQQEEGMLGVTGMGGPRALAISGDGAHVYVGSGKRGVAVFARDSGTGLLTFVESHQARLTDEYRSVAVSPNGGYVVASAPGGVDPGNVALFARDAGTGKLTLLGGDGFDRVAGVAITDPPSGTPTVYAASPTLGSVGVFQAVTLDCTPTPKTGCAQPADPHRAFLYMKRNTLDAAGDRLVWKWIRGAQLDLDEFGDPVNGTDHVVTCIYDGSAAPQPVAEMLAPAAGICKGKPCWNTSGTSIKYKDSWLLPDGVSTISIRAGAATRSSIKLKGKGGPLPLPSLPLIPPVTVQLQSATDGCWEAIYSTATLNDGERFEARAD